MLHGSCIEKIAKLQLNYQAQTFFAVEFQVGTSVLYYSSNNKLITAEFKYAKGLISKEQFPIEIIVQDENHNFINIIDVKVNN